jgi:UDP-N-acetylmuramoyl-tripeptide--D-alanyl-D-alanine ligase
MTIFEPEEISSWSGGYWTKLPTIPIQGFAIDSRSSCEDALFVALRAERDGHEFLSQAIVSGAIGGLVDHPISEVDCPQLVVQDTQEALQKIAAKYRSNFSGTVIGVTGSCGKTSTKELLKVLLPKAYCTEGNLNNHLGVPLTLSKVSSLIHDIAVVEAGINQINEMDRLATMINPDVCVISSIGYSHLEGLKNLETVAEEKIKLWLHSKDNCFGVFHEDLLQFKCFATAVKQRPHILIRNGNTADTLADENVVTFVISTETKKHGHLQKLIINRCGCPPLVLHPDSFSEGTIKNMVLAVVVAWKQGVSDEEICERLPQYRPSGLRGSCLVGRGCSYTVDCYNANPSSMLDSIQHFYQKYHDEPKLMVLGGMNELGEMSALLHHKTGSLINLTLEDRVILIGNDSLHFARGLIENGAEDEQILILEEPESALAIIEQFKGAVLLKGSRSYQLEKLVPSWAVEEFEPLLIAC